ncbi:pesticin C-terminus-like muramidase [Acidithiobacillus sp. IBUN Pt1247-S3]|uniref:pesticin C-terminus-like muramidase n=1 Tax=Acidithiobacillus sp. IBUN Pt1247-S3 TaxID=3166642 RepID=UPI0034E404E5
MGNDFLVPKRVWQVGVLAAVSWCGTADAFDCKLAKTPVEKTICAHNDLKLKDAQLNHNYTAWRTHEEKMNNKCMLAYEAMQQKEWLRERDKCEADTKCIADAYDKRMAEIDVHAHACLGLDADVKAKLGAACAAPPVTAPVSSGPTAPTQSAAQPSIPCSSANRADSSFLETSEGGLYVGAYVPGFYGEAKMDKNRGGFVPGLLKSHPDFKAAGSSGVTIGVGVDLGQQTANGLRNRVENYVRKYGKPASVDVNELVSRLSPYMGLKLQAAVDALQKHPLFVSKEEASLLSNAIKASERQNTEKLFNNYNTMGVTFQQLPEAAQTVLLDFTYQYGSQADEIHTYSSKKCKGEQAVDNKDCRKTKQAETRYVVWKAFYAGDWETLAGHLAKNDLPDRRYASRRQREGNLLKQAIQRGALPQKGSPCGGENSGARNRVAIGNERRKWYVV